MKYLLFIVLVLQFISNGVFSQRIDFEPKIEYFSFPNSEFNSEEITDIKVDQDGYVWIISFSSIYKYNGNQFVKIESRKVNHGTFLRFHEDLFNRKYVNDIYGSIFFIEKEELVPYKDNATLEDLNTLNKSITYAFRKDSSLHFSFINSDHYSIKNGTLTNHSAEIPENKRGFFATYNLGNTSFLFQRNIERITKQVKFALLDSLNGIIDSVIYSSPISLSLPISQIRLPNGNDLIALDDNLLIEFNRKQIIRNIRFPYPVIRLFKDNRERIWINTYKNGIYLLDTQLNFNSEKVFDLPGELAYISDQDYQNGYWLFSEKKGLGYVSNLDLKYYYPEKSGKLDFNLNDSILSLSQANQLTLVNINTGTILKKVVSKKTKNIREHLYNPETGIVWVCPRGKIVSMDKGLETEINVSMLPKLLSGGKLAFDQLLIADKNMLLGHGSSSYFIANQNRILLLSDVFKGEILDVLKVKETFWINTSNGIYMDSPEGRKPFLKEKLRAKSMLLWGESIVLSYASKGIYLYDQNEYAELTFNGSSLLDCDLVIENDTSLWAISTDGCFNIKKKKGGYEILAFRRLPTINYDKIESNGALLVFSTTSGEVGNISFNQIRQYKAETPLIRISKLITADSINLSTIPEKIEFDYTQRNFTLEFESIDYQNLNSSFRYQLKGLDSAWISTNSNSLNFASLPPGEYTFMVQSKFGIGNWASSKKIAIKIKQPFWQKWWFILGAIMGILLLVFSFFKIRYDRLAKEQLLNVNQLKLEQRALRAQMSPHYIFNVITSLKYLILEEKTKKANQFLDLFSKSIRNSLDQSNASFISVEDEIKFLKEYIELEKFRTEDSFSYQIESSVPNLQDKIPSFIIQPFVENAIKHGLKNVKKEASLSILFQLNGDSLHVIVEDNGIGRIASNPRKKKRQSHGIRLIQERLKIHNQSNQNIIIEDLIDEQGNALGTKVIIKIRVINENELEEKDK